MSPAGDAARFGLVDRQRAAAMSGIEFLQGMIRGDFPAAPIAETAGFRLSEVEAGRAVFEGQPSRRFYNPLGTVHGGWIATLLDSAMGCAVHTLIQAGQTYTTVDFSVSLVRPVLETSGMLICEGRIVHAGRRIATSEGRLVDQAGKLFAHGTETCLIMQMSDAA
jgi:uncharacterized protein (TIGR00369 family)